MKRLLATMRCDVRLQFRNGFYYAVAFIVVVWAAFFSQLPWALDLGWLLPGLVLGNLVINTFYFISGLVLLEKGEGTLVFQVVTPLRNWEYLTSKVATLAALSVVENVALVVLIFGLRFNVLLLLAGIALASAIYVLAGFAVVARYDSVNEYLFPSALYVAPFTLPLINYYGLWESWLFYLHPMQAPLLLMQAAFQPIEAWQLAYGVLYAGLWAGVAYVVALRAFRRFVVAGEGIR